MAFNITIAIVTGYLIGSIPFPYIAARLKKGVDIRQVGGGNMGAVNVAREIGLPAGIAVLIADIGKGALAVFIARWLGLPLAWIFVVGLAAVVGHNWPVFLKFRGGKGMATTLGVLLALVPLEAGISFGIIVTILVITSNMRLAVFAGLAFLPLITWLYNQPGAVIAYTLALPLFTGFRSLASFRKERAKPETRRSLIFDREYHFWQTKKKH
jgi:acyl phosphate:glycerol-3-phosphate acyltransferase